VDNTRDYARVSHRRQWSNYNVNYLKELTQIKYELCILFIRQTDSK